jgi:hypothetical protein
MQPKHLAGAQLFVRSNMKTLSILTQLLLGIQLRHLPRGLNKSIWLLLSFGTNHR